jgi:hypothetical protein
VAVSSRRSAVPSRTNPKRDPKKPRLIRMRKMILRSAAKTSQTPLVLRCTNGTSVHSSLPDFAVLILAGSSRRRPPSKMAGYGDRAWSPHRDSGWLQVADALSASAEALWHSARRRKPARQGGTARGVRTPTDVGTFIAGRRAIFGTIGTAPVAREFPHWTSLALGQRIITDLGMEIQSPLIKGQVNGD